jgi:hypothetical protein
MPREIAIKFFKEGLTQAEALPSISVVSDLNGFKHGS